MSADVVDTKPRTREEYRFWREYFCPCGNTLRQERWVKVCYYSDRVVYEDDAGDYREYRVGAPVRVPSGLSNGCPLCGKTLPVQRCTICRTPTRLQEDGERLTAEEGWERREAVVYCVCLAGHAVKAVHRVDRYRLW